MAVIITCTYDGELHTTAVHGPSGERILTDAPVDNRGKGERFSPTDLMAASIGSCAITIMGIAALDRGWSIEGTTAAVVKEMGAQPRRHIARLGVTITVRGGPFDEKARAVLEAAARSCPVQASLGPLTRLDLEFVYR